MENEGNSDVNNLISNRSTITSRNRNLPIVEQNDNTIVPGARTGINSAQSLPSDNTNIQYSPSNCKAYVAVIILCFINLINYMDRYTLAGLDYFVLHLVILGTPMF